MSRYKKIFEFLKKNQEKIALTLGFILVVVISFAAGRLTLTLKSKSVEIKDEVNIDQNTEKGELIEHLPQTKSEGAYVGDINSNKFYPAESSEASKISDDNKIWFDSASEAEEQGYILGTLKDSGDSKSDANNSDENISSDSNKDTTDEDASLPGKYVGSKNSNKYHLPDSSTAKRIKEENKVWFQSKEEAEAKGYVPGSGVE